MTKHLLAGVFILLFYPLLAQDTLVSDSVVQIGIKNAPPFVELREGFAPRGLSIDFWSEVEGDAQVIYEYKTYEHLSEMLEALEAGEIDLSINPVTVTENRMRTLDFSQPFYISGTTMVRLDNSSWMSIFKNLFTWKFFSAIGALLLVILLFGLLMWLFERKRNKEMFSNGIKGLGDGFWWSAVTMTTVGYGDKAPVTAGGRLIGFIWMFAAILLISGLTASIASALTVRSLDSQINSAEDLRRFKVGTIKSSSSATYLDMFGVNFKGYTSVEEGLKAVEDGDMEVFVYDRPMLKYALNQREETNLVLSKRDLKIDYYSFTYPKGSMLQHYLDPFVVKALRSERWNYRLKKDEIN